MYACIVKNSQGTWDVWNSFSYPAQFADRQERIDAALTSGFLIGIDLIFARFNIAKWWFRLINKQIYFTCILKNFYIPLLLYHFINNVSVRIYCHSHLKRSAMNYTPNSSECWG